MNKETKEKDIIQKSIEGLANAKLNNTSYEVARDIVLDYITNLQEENERLKNGYCELKVKCNNGECDCTNEEYDGMVEANMKISLLLDDYKSRIDKATKKVERIIDYGFDYDGFNDEKDLKGLIDMLVDYADQALKILEKNVDK